MRYEKGHEMKMRFTIQIKSSLFSVYWNCAVIHFTLLVKIHFSCPRVNVIACTHWVQAWFAAKKTYQRLSCERLTIENVKKKYIIEFHRTIHLIVSFTFCHWKCWTLVAVFIDSSWSEFLSHSYLHFIRKKKMKKKLFIRVFFCMLPVLIKRTSKRLLNNSQLDRARAGSMLIWSTKNFYGFFHSLLFSFFLSLIKKSETIAFFVVADVRNFSSIYEEITKERNVGRARRTWWHRGNA